MIIFSDVFLFCVTFSSFLYCLFESCFIVSFSFAASSAKSGRRKFSFLQFSLRNVLKDGFIPSMDIKSHSHCVFLALVPVTTDRLLKHHSLHCLHHSSQNRSPQPCNSNPKRKTTGAYSALLDTKVKQNNVEKSKKMEYSDFD